ncbi:TetR/AcrR family transcriptional regulator [Pararhodobacter oceanensis]|uniref:TetR/AcrR family transcriptional regulator n=1 Tax=Pararhodobacter oceanensis TaxID=2172121 RepID=UPI001402310D|nr:TetR/AcrR family transcriptional regulator [Pararhodobacter oceanensis]
MGRDHIITATRGLLRRVPPSSLTRKLVAEEAGVDPALVRYYFSDLRHLLTEVLKVLVKDYGERFRALDIDPSSPEDALKKRIRHLVTFLTEETSFHELFIEQIINGHDEWALETRDWFTDQFFGTLSEIIETGRKDGLFRDDFDPRFLYLSIIGAGEFLATSRTIFTRLFGPDQTPNDVADEFVEFLFQTLMQGIAKK